MDDREIPQEARRSRRSLGPCEAGAWAGWVGQADEPTIHLRGADRERPDGGVGRAGLRLQHDRGVSERRSQVGLASGPAHLDDADLGDPRVAAAGGPDLVRDTAFPPRLLRDPMSNDRELPPYAMAPTMRPAGDA